MENSSDSSLPKILFTLLESEELDAREVDALQFRIQGANRITDDIERWIASDSSPVREFLDALELDLSVLQNLPGGGPERVTSYAIHSSWTFELAPNEMRRCIDPDVAKTMSVAPPSIDSSLVEFSNWANLMASSLRKVCRSFSRSEVIEEAMAMWIAIDVLLLLLLVGTTQTRLNAGLMTLD